MEQPNARRPRGTADPAPRGSGRRPTEERDALNARLDALASRRRLPPPPPPASGRAQRTSRTRRRHAARGARAAALGLSLASTGALASLFALTGGHASAGRSLAPAAIVASPAAPSPTAPSGAGPTSIGTSTIAPVATTPTAAPAIVDGAVFHNRWGDVQVEAVFAPDGTLVDVTTLQTPYRDGKSVRINERAVPQLNSEALTAQSADVDTVSGATYTSNDYHRSLQSAIDAARAAGLTSIV